MAFSNYALRSMIKEHGVVSTLVKRAAGAYNITDGKVTQTETNYTVRCYTFNYSPEILSQRVVSDTDSRALLDPLMTNGDPLPAPQVDDAVVVQGKTLKIIKVDAIRSAGKIMCWLLDTRA
jgi:hypothetical protein